MEEYGIPATEGSKAAATDNNQKSVPVEEKVKEALKILTEVEDKEKQKEELAKFDEAIVYAARAEKRRRDTQAAYTKAQQEAISLKKEKETLEQLIAKELEKSLDLSPEQKEELEELKLVDPDEWRKKLNEIEKEQKTLKKNKIKELTKKAKEEADKEFELKRRQEILEEFNKTHPDVRLDDEVIANEIPPKYVKELEQGKISFEEFLEKAYNFLKSNKVVAQDKAPQKPDLTKVPGGATPSDNARYEDIYDLYKKETF